MLFLQNQFFYVQITSNAIKYTITQLLTIALPAIDWHIIHVDEKHAEVEIFHNYKLHFTLLDKDKIELLLLGQISPIYAFSFDEKREIPLFPVEQREGFYKKTTHSITFTADLITLPFLLLSHYDYETPATRDLHDRQTFKHSLNEIYNIIDFPLVDHYALLIRKVVQENGIHINIIPRTAKFIVTHDIDELYRFYSLYKTIKTILGGDLWVRRSLNFFKQSVRQLLKTLRNRIYDPYIAGLQQLIESTQKMQRDDIEQIVFIKSLETGEKDATYDIHDPILSQLIDYLTVKGVKIGLHGGYYSYNNSEIYQQEQSRLTSLLQHPVTLGRQHFLRYNRNSTLHIWQRNGLLHDYSIGFAEREGFRCGTCHPYPIYDVENDCITTIIEHPLIAMDGTFFQYQHTTPEMAYCKMQQLYETCREVEGDFVLLWHNTIVYREFEIWFRNCFYPLIKKASL